MLIIPVIDICRGQVVHARQGNRAEYLPVMSRLCRGSDPMDIASAFMDLNTFQVLYIADLDAITGSGDNLDVIKNIRRAFSGIDIWLDNGNHASTELYEKYRIIPVIGSETNITPMQLSKLQAQQSNIILSLDFRDEKFLGDPAILQSESAWPGNLIVMNLSKVGSHAGPDINLIKNIQYRAGNNRIFCGGGVRSMADLRLLAEAGTDGALIATALHNGTIDRTSLQEPGEAQ